MVHLERCVLLYPNLDGTWEDDAFTFTDEETKMEKEFQIILGSFEITFQPFCFVTFQPRHGPLSIAVAEHHKLGNYLRLEVGLAPVFGDWEV